MSGFIEKRYIRATHTSDGRSKTLSESQEALWREYWPIGSILSLTAYKSAEEVHSQAKYVYHHHRLGLPPLPSQVKEALEKLEEAKLVQSSLFAGSWK